MRTIKIAPDASECSVVGNEVIGKFNGRKLVYQIPSDIEVYGYQHALLIENFRAAIAMSSKPWQAERMLNTNIFRVNTEQTRELYRAEILAEQLGK